MKKFQILATNDDGIEAVGLWTLVHALESFANITVVAPEKEQSATGMGITIHEPIQLQEYKTHEGRRGWAIGGTPTDCVKLAIEEILGHIPDMIVSGINLGDNAGKNALYSGTVGAALEGALHKIPSIAVSLASYKELIFEPAAKFTRDLAENILENNLLPAGIALNVNVPAISENEMKQPIFATQGTGVFQENFDKRLTPSGKPYYWMSGEKIYNDSETLTDENAVRAGHITITPIRPDFTTKDIPLDLQKKILQER